jgi:hypothetical protein
MQRDRNFWRHPVFERMQSLSLQEVYMPFRYVPGLALIANDVVSESVEK